MKATPLTAALVSLAAALAASTAVVAPAALASTHHHHRHHHATSIPQRGAGDHDADNNGGPSDGDGNV